LPNFGLIQTDGSMAVRAAQTSRSSRGRARIARWLVCSSSGRYAPERRAPHPYLRSSTTQHRRQRSHHPAAWRYILFQDPPDSLLIPSPYGISLPTPPNSPPRAPSRNSCDTRNPPVITLLQITYGRNDRAAIDRPLDRQGSNPAAWNNDCPG